jgi:hypothetical protein
MTNTRSIRRWIAQPRSRLDSATDGDWVKYEDHAAELERHQWRPISTAARGGRWVLLWWPAITDCAVIGYRAPDGWRCPIGSYGGYDEKEFGSPSHWMPLPEPPSALEPGTKP